MKYLLDTNTCIRYLNGRAPSVRQRLQQESPADIATCSVVKAELFYGAMRSVNPARSLAAQQAFLSLFVSLPFDDAAASEYGKIRALLTIQGNLIGPNDLMIAAIAVTHSLVLVTHNIHEFERIAGLALEDWE